MQDIWPAFIELRINTGRKRTTYETKDVSAGEDASNLLQIADNVIHEILPLDMGFIDTSP